MCTQNILHLFRLVHPGCFALASLNFVVKGCFHLEKLKPSDCNFPTNRIWKITGNRLQVSTEEQREPIEGVPIRSSKIWRVERLELFGRIMNSCVKTSVNFGCFSLRDRCSSDSLWISRKTSEAVCNIQTIRWIIWIVWATTSNFKKWYCNSMWYVMIIWWYEDPVILRI